MRIEKDPCKLQSSSTSQQPRHVLSMSHRTKSVVGVNYSCSQNDRLVSNIHVPNENNPFASSTSDSIYNEVIAGPITNKMGPSSNLLHPLSPRCTNKAKENEANGAHMLSPNSVAFSSDNSKSTCCDIDAVANHRSNRPKRARKNSIERSRIRYDMNLVPRVVRQPEFLRSWHTHDFFAAKKFREAQSSLGPDVDTFLSCVTSSSPVSTIPIARSDALDSNNVARSLIRNLHSQHPFNHASSNDATPRVSNGFEARSIQSPVRHATADDNAHTGTSLSTEAIPPFADNGSVVWVPLSRIEWKDCIDEMTAVCTTAAWHRHHVLSSSEPFHPPLSRDYIRDRVDIDDPLRGYQIRHKSGGWLQGFVLMTTFTTWTHYFKWDSNHVENGMFIPCSKQELSSLHGKQRCSDFSAYKIDDGSLSSELERQPRSGDPLSDGVIWSTIAEISLLGALGCGEYLLRMALDDISRRGVYRYVVLQATDSSRLFYEKFGFVRVGAVSTYGPDPVTKAIKVDGVVGYRHWTYPNESSETLGMHGAPSCMMALKVNQCTAGLKNFCQNGDSPSMSSFLDDMAISFVVEKPKIIPLVASRGRKRSSFEGCTLPGLDPSQDKPFHSQAKRARHEEV